MSQPQFDLIVYGASSFVGEILTRYLSTTYGVGQSIRWAIAGRSEQKLQQVRGSLADVLQEKAKDLPILLADAMDENALQTLCSQTRVIVSTVGPYALYGEPLVKACAESGTDYCDLTGEAQWIKRMLTKYESAAQDSGARIVHCCGFDSVPSDMGVYYLQQQMQEQLGETAPRIKMRVKAARGGMSGGTVASMLNLVKEAIANPSLRKELANPFSICPADSGFSARQPSLKRTRFDSDFNAWSAPFIMAAINTRVVHRSNALREKLYGEEFIYDETMLTGRGFKGRMTAMIIVAGMNLFMLGTVIKPTRWLLEKYLLPKPGEGPSLTEQENGFFDIRFKGELNDGRNLVAKVTGDRDPGYGSTGKMLGEAVVSLAVDFHEQDQKCGKAGGFWTPASIFDHRFINRLTEKAGLTFSLVEPQ